MNDNSYYLTLLKKSGGQLTIMQRQARGLIYQPRKTKTKTANK